MPSRARLYHKSAMDASGASRAGEGTEKTEETEKYLNTEYTEGTETETETETERAEGIAGGHRPGVRTRTADADFRNRPGALPENIGLELAGGIGL